MIALLYTHTKNITCIESYDSESGSQYNTVTGSRWLLKVATELPRTGSSSFDIFQTTISPKSIIS